MLDFFGLLGGREVRRVELALAEGEINTLRNMVIRALRNRFPNEDEKFFSYCAEKLEKKNNAELGIAFDQSVRCSNLNEFAEAL